MASVHQPPISFSGGETMRRAAGMNRRFQEMSEKSYDAVIVGAGPNGLAAAITLAAAGRTVLVLEQASEAGGGCRTGELTLPGYLHDVCSAIHPLGVSSPFFRSLNLEQYGLEWIFPPSQLAHPFDDGGIAVLDRSLEITARGLGEDGKKYERLMAPLLRDTDSLMKEILVPIRFPRHPFLMARFGLNALRTARGLASRFKTREARALLAGCAAHSMVPLDRAGTASFGMVLLLTAHAPGWPLARGGSRSITEAMIRHLEKLGGEIRTSHPVRRLSDLPPHRAAMFDVTPRQMISIAGDALPSIYRRRLQRFRYGPGVFKVDWALDGPIPWRSPQALKSATVHVGGTLEEIEVSEAEAWNGKISERPFVLVAQQSQFDPTRAPEGKQTGWAYCHVPAGSTVDMTAAIEKQIERFAPGFSDRILHRHTMNTHEIETHNPNMIGGDIGGGANTLTQVLGRPLFAWDPYSTPNEKIFLCSSSTPPGGGVHGMCGYSAAKSALKGILS